MGKELMNCPFCGRKAELFIGKEMPDTSRVHKLRCSYLNCMVIENSLSGCSPNYKEQVEKMKDDWNTAVTAIIKNNNQQKLN